MGYFAGIDGGGTKTECAIGDGERELGRGRGGSSNLNRVDEATVRTSLEAAIAAACQHAGIMPAQVEAVCLGAAGAARESVLVPMRQMLEGLLPGCVPARAQLMGDHELALFAAFGDGPGVIVIAGTGSMVMARDEQGRTARAGGWGWAISDEGSGHWIGRTAVRAALRDVDRGKPDTLLGMILKAWHIADVDSLVRETNHIPPANFAQLFPLVEEAAQAGDPLAVSILRRAGGELVQLANIAMRKLWPPEALVRVATVGGVFAHSQEVRETFEHSLRVLSPNAVVDAMPVDAARGALVLARKL